MTQMSPPLKIGLMGYGYAGATFHAPLIEHCGSAQRVAIATSQPERAHTDYPQATLVADFDALIALNAVECIVIATPNDTHFTLAAKALAAGKHVVVDKPDIDGMTLIECAQHSAGEGRCVPFVRVGVE